MVWQKAPRLRWTAFLTALSLAGCAGGFDKRSAKDPVSGLWVEPGQVAQLDDALLSRLARANVEELFVPLAELDLTSGSGPVERRPIPELPAGSRVEAVVGGAMELAGRDLDEAARGVAEGVQQLFFGLESRGVRPAGVHFDLAALDSLADGRNFFKKLRGELDPAVFISLTLRPAWLDDSDMPGLVKAVDYVVAFLYGQREGEADSNEAWDFEVAKRRLERLEEAGAFYMMGVSGVGSAIHLGKQGRVKNRTLEQNLSPFMLNPHLELKQGFSLKATNRRVYTLIARQGTRAGGWEIQPDDEIRLVRPMTSDVAQLLDIGSQGEYPGLVGTLYYRLPKPEERLSISVDNILSASGADPVRPELDFDVDVTRRTRQGALYRFVVTSSNDETTEYSPLNNYLQVSADPNAFGSVKVGDFYRYDLLRVSPDGKSERTIRGANALRLDLPILEGGQRIETGDIEIRQRNPTFRLEAKFMMPDGRILEFGPFTWKDGAFESPEEEEEGGEAAGESD